ncbi:hypothetical protein V500_02455 [Pseudogymnoascus sp. VKM F-4518 (FW-2643)]|nr:hypothetical protein V500_02455 [Pseudogymnoascus sp. VKM F-4518 (FW-2643)]
MQTRKTFDYAVHPLRFIDYEGSHKVRRESPGHTTPDFTHTSTIELPDVSSPVAISYDAYITDRDDSRPEPELVAYDDWMTLSASGLINTQYLQGANTRTGFTTVERYVDIGKQLLFVRIPNR